MELAQADVIDLGAQAGTVGRESGVIPFLSHKILPALDYGIHRVLPARQARFGNEFEYLTGQCAPVLLVPAAAQKGLDGITLLSDEAGRLADTSVGEPRARWKDLTQFLGPLTTFAPGPGVVAHRMPGGDDNYGPR